MYSATRCAIALIVAALLAACSGGPTTPTGQPGGTGSTGADAPFGGTSIRDNPPTGDARNSCPTDAPILFTVGGQGQTDGRYKNTFSWNRVANVARYQVEYQRRRNNPTPGKDLPAADQWEPAIQFDAVDVIVDRYELGPGIFRGRVRSYCGAVASGLWTAYYGFANDTAPAPAAPPVTPPACTPSTAAWSGRPASPGCPS